MPETSPPNVRPQLKRLYVPIEPGEDEQYDVVMAVERVSGNSPLIVGTVIGGTQCDVFIDGLCGEKFLSALADGLSIAARPDAYRGQVIPSGRSATLRWAVRRVGREYCALLQRDGQEIFSWHGDPRRLWRASVPRHDPPFRFFGVYSAAVFRISKIELVRSADTGRAGKYRRLKIVVDASRDHGYWWFPQGKDGFDPARPHQGKALVDRLKGLGCSVHEIPRDGAVVSYTGQNGKLVGPLEGADMVINTSFPLAPLRNGTVDAYQRLLGRGGGVVLLGHPPPRPEHPPDSLAAAFGLRWQGTTAAPLHWRADHPLAQDFQAIELRPPVTLVAGPRSLVAIAWLSNKEPASEAGAVVATLQYQQGTIVALGLNPYALTADFWDRMLGYLAAHNDAVRGPLPE